MTETLFGLLGAMTGVIVSALAGWRVARQDRSQRDEAAAADRRQRHAAARKDQWWSRTQWALDLVLQDSRRSRMVGWDVLKVLGSSEWADARELGIIEAAVAREVDASENPGETGGTGGEAP